MNIQAVTSTGAHVPGAAGMIPPAAGSPASPSPAGERISSSPERETTLEERAQDGGSERADQAQDGDPTAETAIGASYDRAGTAAWSAAPSGSISILA